VALLGMEIFEGPHTGLNQAAVIWQVLQWYNLIRKVVTSQLTIPPTTMRLFVSWSPFLKQKTLQFTL
jgi:hypothetical protein